MSSVCGNMKCPKCGEFEHAYDNTDLNTGEYMECCDKCGYVFVKNIHTKRDITYQYHLDKMIEKKIISSNKIQEKVKSFSKIIPTDAVLVAVLNGSMRFLSDLMRYKNSPYIMIHTVKVNAYQDNKQKDKIDVHFNFDLKVLKKRVVFLVDDIYDSGKTLDLISQKIKPLAASLHWLCLFRRNKTHFRLIPGSIEIPNDAFIVGYGLDYNGYFRGLNDVYAMNKKVINENT